MTQFVSESVKYIGCNDKDIDLFESQYVVPNGIAYNSYVILDDKVAIVDTIDKRKHEEWLVNLDKALEGRKPDYLIIHHMEPDHAGSVVDCINKYPDITLVGNAKTFVYLTQFTGIDSFTNKVVVKEGNKLKLGKHELTFIMAPMVHWPEVMVSYDSYDKILFSADGFGKFGSLDINEEWAGEARRYYFNIVGKYGASVQTLLKKAAALDINIICPTHGPVLSDNLAYYIGLYNTWSSYTPEEKGVLVAYASIHGNTAVAAKKFAEILAQKGEKTVVVKDLSRDDMSGVVEDAFHYDRVVLAAVSYDGGVFPCMDDFLHHLKSKAYQKRTVGIIENGTWAPCAAKAMKEVLEKLKDINILEPIVTIKSALKEENMDDMNKLADAVVNYNK
ncbi:MAG: FprA family A-type flavoprotein [Inconstantimicrobium porci]|uniref:FprA family A-type flavoprotein n=1 Tax=Inconstantimicrobium porci TaxID=2652291 RepID=UPI002A90D084|nr:FprA family A-type flavoprotein [Inconstantimicrobium porci]MDY5911918.1 FprA family A-type flavoprotein [Inconstantimicrobium porci]